VPRLSQALDDCQEILPSNHHLVPGVSELGSTAAGLWLDFFCQRFYFRGKNRQPSRCKEVGDNTWTCLRDWPNIDVRAEYREVGIYRWRPPARHANAESY
jgi:hypothetical protein